MPVSYWDIKENIIKRIHDRIRRLTYVPNPDIMGRATYLKKIALENFNLQSDVKNLIEAENVYYEKVKDYGQEVVEEIPQNHS